MLMAVWKNDTQGTPLAPNELTDSSPFIENRFISDGFNLLGLEDQEASASVGHLECLGDVGERNCFHQPNP